MASTSTSATRLKLSRHRHHHLQPLIPGLPDHIAQLCLTHLHDPSLLFSVSLSWRRFLYSPFFPPFLSLYAFLSPSTPSPPSLQNPNSNSVQFFTFDPISSSWHPLPDPPLLLLRHHPSFLSRNLPIQSVSVAGNLVLLAATTHNLHPAISRPLIFSPLSRNWSFGPTLPNPRRWCALGALRGSVYVASGVGTQFSIDVARSLEKWEVKMCGNNGEWEKKSNLKHGRFSRDAIDAVGWRGKLCVVNVKAKEGVLYDVERDTWEEMSEGMLRGWRGPVGAMAEEVMYGVDEAKGSLSKYDPHKDAWEELMESQRLRGADQLVAQGGRVCVVSGAGIFAVDVMAAPPRMWAVELPAGFEAVAVHVLPRMPVHGSSNED